VRPSPDYQFGAEGLLDDCGATIVETISDDDSVPSGDATYTIAVTIAASPLHPQIRI
jgi:hypothetical protein